MRIWLRGGWFFRADGEEWQPFDIPGPWERHGIDPLPGVGWYRRELRVDQPLAPGATLWLAGIDEAARAWLDERELCSDTAEVAGRFGAALDGAHTGVAHTLLVRVDDRGRHGGILRDAWIDENTRAGASELGASIAARGSAPWIGDGVVYSAYVRSASSTGDFAGLAARLDKIASLGTTVLWLLPIHPVGRVGRKGRLGSPYAVADYRAVNPEFGTLEDLRRLIDAAAKLGIKLIIDWVANHTALDNPLIEGHPDWFARDAAGRIRPPVADWSDVAQLDYSRPALRQWMADAMEWWVRDVGVDGFRCDVADMLPLDFWEQVRARLDAIKPIVMLAEGDRPENHRSAFDLTYDWWTYKALGRLRGGSMRPADLGRVLRDQEIDFPSGSLRLRFVSNHDLNAWHVPAVVRYGVDGLKAAAVITHVLPGVPLVYCGDEVGSPARLDLFDRVPIDWDADDDGVLATWQSLAQLRVEHESLRCGSLRWLDAGDERVLAIERSCEGERTVALVNLADGERRIAVGPLGDEPLLTRFSSRAALRSGELTLAPLAFWIASAADD